MLSRKRQMQRTGLRASASVRCCVYSFAVSDSQYNSSSVSTNEGMNVLFVSEVCVCVEGVGIYSFMFALTGTGHWEEHMDRHSS